MISRGGDDGDAGADGVNRHDEQDAEYVFLGPREVVVVRVQEHVSARQSQGKHLSFRSKPDQNKTTSEHQSIRTDHESGGKVGEVSGHVSTTVGILIVGNPI